MEKPKIRFLKNKHSWVRNTFEEIAKRRTKSSDNPDLPRIEYQDIISGEGRLNKDLNKNIDCHKGIVFETNDILYGKLRPYLKNWLHPNFNGIALGDFWVLQARNCDSKFLFSLVQSPKFQRVANDTSGTKMPRSDWKTVSQTEFSIPTSNEEQSAIGSLFRTLDDLLISYKENLANYQSLKATMFSKMFPKAGLTVPEIRLEGFKGEWEKSKLKDVAHRVQGNDGRMDLPTLTISASGGWMNQIDRFSANIAGKEQKNYTLLKKGELSYNHGNSKLAKYGVVFELQEYEEALVPKVYHSFRVNQLADAKFIEIMFSTKIPDRELGKLISSGARMDGLLNISFDDFMNISIIIPTIKEQQAISAYFSTLDNLINSYQEKISQLETLKKKLLQDMFI